MGNLGENHSDKALRDFKGVLEHQVNLLRKATRAVTAYIYWINRRRKQFVLESQSTGRTNVMFRDRVAFDQHFLNPYKDIQEVNTLEVGDEKSLDAESLTHYYSDPPISKMVLIPLQYNEETIALTVLEFEEETEDEDLETVIKSYTTGLENMTETYMEINQLSRGEQQWEEYEAEIEDFVGDRDFEDPITKLLGLSRKLTSYLSSGGVVMLAEEREDWITLWNTTTHSGNRNIIPGLKMEKGSIAYNCVNERQKVYISHLNGSPRRISSREPDHNGATLAVPVFINGGMEGIMLMYDENPLVFKASVKHKLTNLVRLAEREIAIRRNGNGRDHLFRRDKYGLHKKNVWRQLTEHYLVQAGDSAVPVGIGILRVKNIQRFRARLRLEQLELLEQKLIERSLPSSMGLPGLIGSLEDYSYAVILPIMQNETITYYRDTLSERLSPGFKLNDDEDELDVELEMQFESIGVGDAENIDRVIQSLRRPRGSD